MGIAPWLFIIGISAALGLMGAIVMIELLAMILTPVGIGVTLIAVILGWLFLKVA